MPRIGRDSVTLNLVFSIAAPLATGAVALWWAGLVARGMTAGPETPSKRDLRTW